MKAQTIGWGTLSMSMLIFALAGCATTSGSETMAGESRAYLAEDDGSQLATFAPVFVVEQAEASYNRVGTPRARLNERGKEVIYIDATTPTVYAATDSFETDRGRYTNLFYRVHFEESPFTARPFNASAGHNVGLFAVITLDPQGHPCYVNTVQTCGCFHAVIPTNHVEPSAYPDGWNTDAFENYGETLPGLLRYPDPVDGTVRPVITVRSGTHRAANIEMIPLEDVRNDYSVSEAALRPINELKHIPLGDGETSFYFERGVKRGLVKGAFKPWESVLFGLWIGDLHVGQDREYGSKEATGRRFYTTLNRLKKKSSDMADYGHFLEVNGWHP